MLRNFDLLEVFFLYFSLSLKRDGCRNRFFVILWLESTLSEYTEQEFLPTHRTLPIQGEVGRGGGGQRGKEVFGKYQSMIFFSPFYVFFSFSPRKSR